MQRHDTRLARQSTLNVSPETREGRRTRLHHGCPGGRGDVNTLDGAETEDASPAPSDDGRSDRSQTERTAQTMTNLTTDPFEVFSGATLEARHAAKSPRVKPVLKATVVDLASRLAGKPVNVLDTPAMSLTARHPHDPAGLMDVYRPGRWDCSSNLVFMDVIRQVGPSPGEWEGSVVYARFTAPSNGSYLVVGNFSGYQITMNLSGPWGKNTAYCATTSDHAQATALWNGTAGGSLSFTINMNGPYLGYLESVQVYLLT